MLQVLNQNLTGMNTFKCFSGLWFLMPNAKDSIIWVTRNDRGQHEHLLINQKCALLGVKN